MAEGVQTRVILARPALSNGAVDARLLDLADPSEVAILCFFRREDQRKAALDRFRLAAGSGLAPGTTPDQAEEEIRRKLKEPDLQDEEAIELLIRWWAHVRSESYHIYRLKAAVQPYSTSCLITLGEADPGDIQVMVGEWVDRLSQERERVMGAFGIPMMVGD